MTQRRFFALLVAFSFGLLQTGVRAQDVYEAAQIARRMIAGYMKDINEASKNVTEALTEATGGRIGELDKWQELARQADRYKQTFSGCIPILDQQVRSLVRAVPGAQLPAFTVPNPFAPYLQRARGRMKEIRRAQLEVEQKIALIDQQIAEFQMAIERNTRKSFGEVLEGFIPTQEQLMGEVGLVSFGLYFGPAGAAAAGLAGAGVATLNQFVNYYYSNDALAEQGKAFTGMLQVLRKRRERMETLLDSYQPAMSEMNEVETTLAKYDTSFSQLRQELEKPVKEGRSLAGEAVDEKRKKAEDKYAENRAKPRPPVPVGSRYQYYGTKVAPITSDEYVPQADSILSGLMSAAQAVMDGADPDTFSDARDTVRNKVKEIRRASSQAYAAAQAGMTEAFRNFNNVVCPPIYRRYYDMLPTGCPACAARDPGYAAKVRAARNYLHSALAAARKPLEAQGQQVADAKREDRRVSLVVGSVYEGAGRIESIDRKSVV